MQKLTIRLIVCAAFAVCTLQSPPVWDVVTTCHIPNESIQGLCQDPVDCTAYRQINDVTSIGNMSRLSFVKQVQCTGEEEGKVCCPRDGGLYSNPWIDMTNVITRVKQNPLSIKNRVGSQGMPCGQQDFGMLVNHGQITEIDEFPWMALLIYEKAMNPVVPGCGGALISQSFVVTAAHCLVGPIIQKKGNLKFVRVGEYDLKNDPDCTVEGMYADCTDGIIDVKPRRVIVHPDYVLGSVSQHHDIGLVQLERPLELSVFIRHICLPEPGSSTLGKKFIVCGWGRTNFFSEGREDKIPSPIKLKASLPYFDHGKCSEIYQPQRLQLINGQICAGGHKARDTCSGDSGSPLMSFDKNIKAWVLSGLVSMGPQNCGTAGKPGIYTNVKEYVQWIKTNAHI
ncbi:CLIP domain-containing serine protease B8-like [Ochlerotatus camptorhynchus]|uniref:CLIP domain-containing serine protease B8-like n=1 Tax=Ochlerotatus camptorhynchus TaxID=644619 RepID=UPI0031D428C8